MRPRIGVRHVLVPLAAAAVLVGLAALGAESPIRGPVRDLLVRLQRPVAPRHDIVLLDIDDEAVSLAGAWPWPRSILADGLVTLRELSARDVVVQVPLAQRSAPSLDAAALRQELPDALSREFTQIEQNVQSLFDAIRRGSVRPQDASRYVTDLVGLVAMAKVRLFNAATGIERDDDALFGQAAGFFGSTFVPLQLAPVGSPAVGAETAVNVLDHLALAITTRDDPSPRFAGVTAPVAPAAQGARGGGFLPSDLLPGGVRRSVPLVATAGGRHYAHVALAALVDYLGRPAVELRPGELVLRKAVVPGAAAADITVPLAADGTMALDWASGSPARLSWSRLLRYDDLEAALVAALRELDARGWLGYLRSNVSIMDAYEHAARLRRDMLAAGTADYVDEWRAARDQFYSLTDQLLSGDAQARIMADADRAATSRALTEAEKQAILAVRASVPGLFAAAQDAYSAVTEARDALRAALKDAFVIVSPAGSYDTAPGRTPRGDAASSGALSAALVDTIMSRRFTTAAPDMVAMILAAALALAFGLLTFRLRPLVLVATGVGACVIVAVAAAGLFLVMHLFLDPVLPIAALAVSTVGLAVPAFRGRRGRAAAAAAAPRGHAPARPPARPAVREVAVLSAGLRGLAGVAIPKDPSEATRALRAWHDGLGLAVVSQKGTVTAAPGDALCALFGAVNGVGDGGDAAVRAACACRAALRMRAIEGELSGGALGALSLRIGIDAGPCVVGSPAAFGAKDGTGWAAVGPASDIAARLQALTFRYGAFILVSGTVKEAAAHGFHHRTLETLRVAGTSASVRVYELLAERDGADPSLREMLGAFEEGRERYEARDWARALSLFNRALAARPSDGPSAVFADRCRQAIADPSRLISSPPC